MPGGRLCGVRDAWCAQRLDAEPDEVERSRELHDRKCERRDREDCGEPDCGRNGITKIAERHARRPTRVLCAAPARGCV